MNTLENRYDAIEKIIYEEGIRIETVDIHPEQDVMLILLNTKAVLKRKLSDFKRLHKASQQNLEKFELTGKGTGIYWPMLDEDLSLKGFLRDELLQLVKKDAAAA